MSLWAQGNDLVTVMDTAVSPVASEAWDAKGGGDMPESPVRTRLSPAAKET
jgi:hypothetical protein